MDHEATLALQLDRLMRRFQAELHPRAVEIDAAKVGPIGGMMLIAIGERGAISSQALAAALGRDKSQISRVVSLLIQKQLVEKRAHAEDGRVSDLVLTERGELQVAGFNGALKEATRQTLSALSRDEMEQFSAMLSKVLQEAPDPP
ncbi:MAG: MarR family transcriptional regulator [Henriciella sp.]|nr:MarR family transcriptional regulator [Henriciella sp.]